MDISISMIASETSLLNPGNVITLSDHSILYSTSCTLLTNSSSYSVESTQRQGIQSNLVGTTARGYSGNAIPIMASPDNGNATRNGMSPVATDSDTYTQPPLVYCEKGNATDESRPGRNTQWKQK